MNKRTTNVSKDRDSGIEVKVTMGKHECEVTLIIPMESIICQHFGIKNKDFECRIKLDDSEIRLSGVATLRFVGKYTKMDYGFLKSRQLTFKFKEEGYSGTLILNPKFYIPAEKCYSPARVKEVAEIIDARRRERASQKG